MPASSLPGWFTGSPMEPSPLMRCTVTLLGSLWAVSRYSPDPSTLVWIGRDGRDCGSPCGARAPEPGSMRKALARCVGPATPGPPLVETTEAQRFGGCGQAYCTLAGSVTVLRFCSAASATSTSNRVSSGPVLA